MPIVERLTETDALFLHVERDDIVIQVAMVFVLDGPIAYDRYVDWLAPRLDRLPRLRHVLKRAPFNLRLPAWAEADRFDLGDHVSRDRVEAPGGAEQLRARVTELFARPLRRDIPLWRVHVIEGLEGNRSAIMLCTHHCLTDGAGFLEMAKVFFEDPPEGWPQHTQASREDQVRRRNGWAPVRVVRALMSRTGRARAGAMLRYLRAPGPWFPFSRPVSGRMHFAWWPVPLDELRAVRNASGATITEIVVSVLTGALARYAKDHDLPADDQFLRLQLAANIRLRENYGKLGNEVSVVPLAIPLTATDAVDRLRIILEHTRAAKALGMAEFMHGFFRGLLDLLTPPGQVWFARAITSERFLRFERRVARAPRDHTCTTSVVLPPLTFRAQGANATTMMPMVPCSANMGLINAALGYGGHIQFTLAADPEGLPDIDRLMEHAQAEFAELKVAYLLESPRPDSHNGDRVPPLVLQPAEAAGERV